MKTIIRCALAFGLALTSVTTTLTAQEFKVIVNSANGTAELPSGVMAKLFLKQVAKFPNGTAVLPVDLAKTSAVRASFSKAALGRAVGAIETYWQQQIFSGKDVPPESKSSDDDVVAYVKANPGAIGYVKAGASTAGVKVVEIK